MIAKKEKSHCINIVICVTHSVWHGFNYSPPDAPFPGWVQYGTYHNENNNWWPYVKYLNRYKARLSSVLTTESWTPPARSNLP